MDDNEESWLKWRFHTPILLGLFIRSSRSACFRTLATTKEWHTCRSYLLLATTLSLVVHTKSVILSALVAQWPSES